MLPAGETAGRGGGLTYLSQFGSQATGPGQFESPGAVAVNTATGDVYVTDITNDVVDDFSASGSFRSGVPPTEVAAWRGHSVEILMRTCAKCMTRLEEVWTTRMDQALRLEDRAGSSVSGGIKAIPSVLPVSRHEHMAWLVVSWWWQAASPVATPSAAGTR